MHPASSRPWFVFVLLAGATLLLIVQLAGAASIPSSQLGFSPLPTPTPNTPQPTATPPPCDDPVPEPTPTAPAYIYRSFLPLVTIPISYGWKGVGNGIQSRLPGSDSSTKFWGIDPDWWYDWGGGNGADNGTGSVTALPDVAQMLAITAASLPDPKYVPMIYCPADVNAGISPSQAAELAEQYPGRVWLIFNEPDNDFNECGTFINNQYEFHDHELWDELGTYLGEQYGLYYQAIKTADPTARLFPLGLLQLPMPDLDLVDNLWGNRSLKIWNSFLAEVSAAGQAIDGIAIHAYPNLVSTRHTGCSGFLDPNCVIEAVEDAYSFFQGSDGEQASQNQHPAMTQNKPVWITEIGALTSELILTPEQVRNGLQLPFLNWFASVAGPGQPCELLDGVAWFSTHSKREDRDFTATALLDYHRVSEQALTKLGETWRDFSCMHCECPGPDCTQGVTAP